MFRKMAVAAVMALVAMLAVSQPAMAGVGGCIPRPGVGGCWQLTTNTPTTVVPVTLDSLRGAIPHDVIAALNALYKGGENSGLRKPGDTTSQGVGGCIPRPGVGGCWQ